MPLTGDQHLLKGLNRMAIVRHLSAHPGQSRAAVAEALGLTKSTISLLVRGLLDDGWLLEREVVATGELGRRPTPLYLNPDRLVLLGAELAVDGIRVVATSLSGDILARASAPRPDSPDARVNLAAVATLLLQVWLGLARGEQDVIGIGIGIPGGVEEQSGYLRFAPNLGWRNVPAARWLAEQLQGTPLQDTPLYLQNEADMAAIGELEFARDAKPTPLIYLSLGHGVGAGVIVGDHLLTGAHGLAGEVGHSILQVDGPLCSCGRRGCAEAMIGFRAMLPPAPEDSAQHAPRGASLPAILQHLGRGDADCEAAVGRAGRYLGMLLVNLIAAYDPGCIVLGGAAVELGDALLAPAFQTLQAYAGDAGMKPPQVTLSRFGSDAVAVGAAALARYRLTRPLNLAGSLAASIT
jgi:predicted NBD/HSP70 family sugar kinase